MGIRHSTIAYTQIETVTYREDYANVLTIRIDAQEHQLPPSTPFQHRLFLTHWPKTDGLDVDKKRALQCGWEGETIVFYLPRPFTGTLVLSASITTLITADERP